VLEPALEFTAQHAPFLTQDFEPCAEFTVLPSMMLQPCDCEWAGVATAVKQEWFAPAKVRYPRTPDFFGEMPIAILTILFQFVHAMVLAYVLQIRHGNFEFSALPHRVNKIIHYRLLVEIAK